MPTRTGTASQVDGSAGSGSTSVTVPAGANAVVAFWCQYDGAALSTLTVLTLNSVGFTVRAQREESGLENCVGVATLESPATGSQTLAWTWGNGGARDEGGEIVLIYVADANLGDVFRDADIVSSGDSGTNASVTIDSTTTDLVLGFGESFGVDPAVTGTAFINNATLNGHNYDVSEVTAGATTTTVATTNPEFSSAAAISLKVAEALSYLRPDADSALDGWTDQAAGTTNIYQSIDETSFSDADYVISPAVVGTTADLKVRLMEGVTQIAQWTHTGISDTFVDGEQTLSTPEFESITDFSDLFIELDDNQGSVYRFSLGDPAAGVTEPFTIYYRYKKLIA